jgi:hypothetical protein
MASAALMHPVISMAAEAALNDPFIQHSVAAGSPGK